MGLKALEFAHILRFGSCVVNILGIDSVQLEFSRGSNGVHWFFRFDGLLRVSYGHSLIDLNFEGAILLSVKTQNIV